MSTVLTIDDSKVVRTMVARHLQPYGCTVVEAQNGVEGLAAARQHHPDLILLDVTMPVMDGRQCLAELRKDELCRAIPVVMLTAESGRDLVVELAKLGVSGYIVKPFEAATFDKEVGKVLGAAHDTSAGQATAATTAASAPDPTAVLVVDDSERVLEAARAALAGSMKVLTALGGRAAIAEYRSARPAYVVVDLAMPDMDGFATLAALQPLGESNFVALALRGDTAAHERAKKAGFRAVVEKPFRGAELLERLRALGAGPGDAVQAHVEEHAGCSVVRLPEPGTEAKVAPLLLKKLRALAEDGADKVIVDLATLADITGDQITTLARLLETAATLGIRTAICAADAGIVERLQQVAETKSAPCAPTRDEAASRLA